MAKLTNKDYFVILSNVLANYEDTAAIIDELGYEDVAPDAVAEFVGHQIDLIDARRDKEAQKRAEKPADELTNAIFALLDGTPTTADTLLEKVLPQFPESADGKPTSVAMIRARLNKLYKDGKIDKTDITVNDKSKKAYFIPATA